MPNRESLLKGTHVGSMYVVNLILNKFLNGVAENRTKTSLEYLTGADVPKQTNNTLVNKVLTKVRNLFEETYRKHILIDPRVLQMRNGRNRERLILYLSLMICIRICFTTNSWNPHSH